MYFCGIFSIYIAIWNRHILHSHWNRYPWISIENLNILSTKCIRRVRISNKKYTLNFYAALLHTNCISTIWNSVVVVVVFFQLNCLSILNNNEWTLSWHEWEHSLNVVINILNEWIGYFISYNFFYLDWSGLCHCVCVFNIDFNVYKTGNYDFFFVFSYRLSETWEFVHFYRIHFFLSNWIKVTRKSKNEEFIFSSCDGNNLLQL